MRVFSGMQQGAARATAPAWRRQGRPAVAAIMGRPRVLVADAQLLFADALSLALGRGRNLQVVKALPTSGKEAVAAIAADSPDVALLDYRLTGMEGPAVVRAVHAQAPATKVVHLSWFYGPDDVERSLAAGAAGFLPKNVRVSVIADAVRRVHHGERAVLAGRTAGLTPLPGPAAPDDPPTPAALLATLTPRQMEILRLAADGLAVRDIARRLDISEGTVRTHIHNILSRTGTRSQLEAVALARDAGVLW